MDINELCSYRIDCYGCPRENDCAILKKKSKTKTIKNKITIEERNNKLKYFIACLKCEIHGKECDDNCPTQYDAGNMGEIIENLEAISKILEQEPCEVCISRQAVLDLAITIETDDYSGNEIMEVVDINDVKALPSVQPKPKTDVLDKIRAEIKALNPKPTAYDVVDGNPVKDAIWETLVDVLQIIDKYKAESEVQ